MRAADRNKDPDKHTLTTDNRKESRRGSGKADLLQGLVAIHHKDNGFKLQAHNGQGWVMLAPLNCKELDTYFAPFTAIANPSTARNVAIFVSDPDYDAEDQEHDPLAKIRNAGIRHAVLKFEDRLVLLVPHTIATSYDAADFAELFRRKILECGTVDDWETVKASEGDPVELTGDYEITYHEGKVPDHRATMRAWMEPREQSQPDRATPQQLQQAPDKGRPLVEGMVMIGDYGVIYSPPNVGKTTFAVTMGHCVANGINFLGFLRTKRARVIYADLEFNNLNGMLAACADTHGTTPDGRDRFIVVHDLPDLGNDAAVDIWCKRIINDHGDGPYIVIVDTQRKAARNSTFNGQALKENGNDDMTVIANALMRISCRLNGAAFSLHHTTKASDEIMAGGGALEAGITSAFVLTVPDKSKPNLLNIAATKRRGNGMPKSVWYGIELLDVRIMTPLEEAAARKEDDDWFGDSVKSAHQQAPSHSNPWEKFEVGPQTHAKTVFPGLFAPFAVVNVKQQRGNQQRQEEKQDRIREVSEFIRSRESTTVTDIIDAGYAENKVTALRYIERCIKSCTVKVIRESKGRLPAKYGPA